MSTVYYIHNPPLIMRSVFGAPNLIWYPVTKFGAPVYVTFNWYPKYVLGTQCFVWVPKQISTFWGPQLF